MEYADDGNTSVYSDYDYHLNGFQPWEWDSGEYVTWVVFSVLDSLAAALGLLANALLLTLFAKAPPLRTVSNMFLLQRSVADMLLWIVVLFIVYDRIYYYLQFPPLLCAPLIIIMLGAMFVSNVFLMLFTMDSYLASRPLQFTLTFRHKVMRITSTVAWLLAVVFAVSVFFYHYNRFYYCAFYDIFFFLNVHEIVIHLVVPLLVVWVFVSMTLCCRPVEPSSEPKTEEGCGTPNRHLLLSLSAAITVTRVLFPLGFFLFTRRIFIHKAIIFLTVSLPNFEKVLNPILVIYFSAALRQKVAGWLPARHSATVPLQDL